MDRGQYQAGGSEIAANERCPPPPAVKGLGAAGEQYAPYKCFACYGSRLARIMWASLGAFKERFSLRYLFGNPVNWRFFTAVFFALSYALVVSRIRVVDQLVHKDDEI